MFKTLSRLFAFSFFMFFSLAACASTSHLNVATWNIRQLSTKKMKRKISTQSEDQIRIDDFIINWIEDNQIDVLSVQEIYQTYSDGNEKTPEDAVALLESKLPADYKMIKGQNIQQAFVKSKKNWKEFCPIVYNSKKITCYSSEKDSMIPIGQSFVVDKKAKTTSVERLAHWAYCSTEPEVEKKSSLKTKRFDFVLSCIHSNYRNAKDDLEGMKKVISRITQGQVDLPKTFLKTNKDYIFAGDFNIDRRSVTNFKKWEVGSYVFNNVLPEFPKKTRWRKQAFTKLIDVYSFPEMRARSKDIYDDVLGTQALAESLLFKFVDPLIDQYFINKKNRVDTSALLQVSDHLPVIATYELLSDTD